MKAIKLVGLILVLASVAYGTEREVNKYKTHKLSLNSVLISCNDEREPVVKKLDGPFVVISCQTGTAEGK